MGTSTKGRAVRISFRLPPKNFSSVRIERAEAPAARYDGTISSGLAEQAHELGLEVLLEIHSAEELPYINSKIDMIGINNRNLGTFFTDVENSFRLAGQLPQDAVLVSESGISDPEVVKRLRTAGFRGFLIGETFMKTPQPGETLQNFLKAIQ